MEATRVRECNIKESNTVETFDIVVKGKEMEEIRELMTEIKRYMKHNNEELQD